MFKVLVAGTLLIASICLAATAGAQTCPPGFGNPTIQCGARLGPNLETKHNIAHPQACKFFCDGNMRCRAWTYVNATKDCQLKSEAAPVRNDACCYTGIKFN